jgi:hypothetical protein
VQNSDNDYKTWTTEQLENQSHYLYEEYLKGQDYLNDIHLISEILRERIKCINSSENG